MSVKKGNKVKIKYKAMFEDGNVFDSSDNFEFEVGGGKIIRGVDQAVVGMERGEEKELTVEPKDAYGAREDKYIIKIPRSQIQGDVKVGMVLKSSNGLIGRIIDVGDEVTVDFNHPLAGKTLKFWIKVIDYS